MVRAAMGKVTQIMRMTLVRSMKSDSTSQLELFRSYLSFEAASVVHRMKYP